MYSIHTPVYYAIDDSYELTLNEKKIRYTSASKNLASMTAVQ
jgi:hypothetical protein